MSRWLGLRARLRGLLMRDDAERRMREEMEFHVEMETARFEREGHAPAESRRLALIAFGSREHVKEEMRDHRRVPVIERALHEVRYALRSLARSPGLSMTIVVTLGLGIGANAAIFATLDRVFLRPPTGIEEPDGLLRLYAHRVSARAPLGPDGKLTPFLTTRDFLDLTAATSGIARIEGEYLYLRGRTLPDSQSVLLTFVTPGYFDMLGVRVQRGRAFLDDESRLPGPPVPVLVISDAFWQNRFARDPAIVGQTLRIDETVYTIIGVAAREFEGLELESVDMWAPLTNVGGGDIPTLRLVARPEQGADIGLFEQRLSAQYRESHAGHVEVDSGSKIITAPILAARGPALSGTSASRIPRMSERNVSLLARLGIVSLAVLLIAVANAASLLLMRAIKRRREIAVRIALGVSRGRLVGQLMTEACILATLGGFAALGTAALTGGLLRTQLSSFIRWTSTVVDVRLAALTMAVAIGAGLVAGLAPAMFALRTDVAKSLKAAGGGTTRDSSRMGSALLITQVALCMALLSGAGVMIQSLRRAGAADRGFDVEPTLMVIVPAHHAAAEEDLRRIATAIAAIPEVERVGRSPAGLTLPGFRSKVGLSVSDTIGESPEGPFIDFVDADWGRAVGVRMIGGRMLDSSSRFEQVAVINETLAKALYRGRNVAGTCIRMREPEGACREVIGVVRDLQWDPSAPQTLRVYVPFEQAWTRPNTAFVPNELVIRLRAEATATDVQRIRDAIAPFTPVEGSTRIQRFADVLEPQLRPWRFAASLFLGLGVLGLIVAATGIHGLIAYDVAQRTRELGVRIALGAPPGSLVRLVVGSALRVVLFGLAAGIVSALVVGRVMTSLLYDTSPHDPAVLVGTAGVMLIAALVASSVPAWRATRVNPAVALAAD